MGQFNTELLKKFIAPCIDEHLDANFPDFTKEFLQEAFWFQNYFLNSVFSAQYSDDKGRRYAECILSRIQMTFSSYHVARTKTLLYIDKWQSGNPGIHRYLAAVSGWESVF